MAKAYEAMRAPVMPDLSKLIAKPLDIPHISTAPSLPSIDYAAMAKSAEEARWAPFRAVNQRLDQLIEFARGSGEFAVQMNQTQTQIAAEIKASSDESTKIGEESLKVATASLKVGEESLKVGTASLKISEDSVKAAKDSLKVARLGFWTTIVVVLLTVMGLGITAASWWGSDGTARKADEHAAGIIGGLSDLKTVVVDEGKASSRGMTALLDELKAGRLEQSKRLDAVLAQQTKLFEYQTTQRATDQAMIETMSKRITQLEEEIRKLQLQSTSRPAQTAPSNAGK